MYSVRPPYLLKKLYSSATWRMSAFQKKIYLTFDDGPVPEITPWVLDVLKYHHAVATFFCVGDNIKKHPDIYDRIVKEKHSIGNHTFNHLNGWNTDTSAYIKNIEKCTALTKTKLFRPPYGRLKPSQVKWLKKSYKIIMWDVLSRDYDKNTSPEQCLRNVCSTIRNGSIIVFHDSHKAFKNLEYTLPRLLSYAQERGYEFERL